MTDAPDICVLWDGDALTWVEQLALASMRDAGHDVTLYAWGEVENLPEGVTWEDADEIGPPDAAPPGLIRDWFRYRVLAARPGVAWVDPDMCLVAPLPAAEEGLLFGREPGGFISPDVLALPADSPALASLIAFTSDPFAIPPWATPEERRELEARAEDGEPIHATEQPWGHWGARALTHFLEKSGEAEAALAESAFFSVPYAERAILNQRRVGLDKVVGKDTAAIPLYGAELKRSLLTSEGAMPRFWCPLGELIRKHEISPREAPIPGASEAPAHLWAPREEKKAEAPAAPAVVKQKAPPAGRVLIVTTMKNEGPFILEWIAYHRAIGVTDFLVYTNDCDDGTDAFHDLLAAKGVIAEHLDNPFRTMNGVKPQHAALWNAQTRPVTEEADWVIGMDVDEFINIHVGDGRFQDLLDAVPDANMISMTWRLFGNGFVRDFQDEFVTERLQWCAHERARKPHQAWGFKTAFRNNGVYRKFGVHRPKGLNEDRAHEIRWYGSAGKEMSKAYLHNGWRASKHNWGYKLVTLNHYSLRSSESYLVKRDRGRVNHVDRDQGLAYWFRMNHNRVRETSILSKLPAAKEEFARLMADPDIAAMHHRCVAAHRAKIDELMRRPDYVDLFEAIESRRLKNLSRMLEHFGNAIFHEGPHAVPEEFLAKADEFVFEDV